MLRHMTKAESKIKGMVLYGTRGWLNRKYDREEKQLRKRHEARMRQIAKIDERRRNHEAFLASHVHAT